MVRQNGINRTFQADRYSIQATCRIFISQVNFYYMIYLTNALSRHYFSRTSGYDFTSDIVPNKAGFPKSQTVEDIILKGYFPVPKSEPETSLISDKNHTARLGLGDIIEQIRNRYLIYEKKYVSDRDEQVLYGQFLNWPLNHRGVVWPVTAVRRTA